MKNGALLSRPQCVNIEAERRTYVSVNLPSLIQIMAYRLVGTKPSSQPILEYREILIKINIFIIEENAFEHIVRKMATLLPRPQCAQCEAIQEYFHIRYPVPRVMHPIIQDCRYMYINA